MCLCLAQLGSAFASAVARCCALVQDPLALLGNSCLPAVSGSCGFTRVHARYAAKFNNTNVMYTSPPCAGTIPKLPANLLLVKNLTAHGIYWCVCSQSAVWVFAASALLAASRTLLSVSASAPPQCPQRLLCNVPLPSLLRSGLAVHPAPPHLSALACRGSYMQKEPRVFRWQSHDARANGCAAAALTDCALPRPSVDVPAPPLHPWPAVCCTSFTYCGAALETAHAVLQTAHAALHAAHATPQAAQGAPQAARAALETTHSPTHTESLWMRWCASSRLARCGRRCGPGQPTARLGDSLGALPHFRTSFVRLLLQRVVQAAQSAADEVCKLLNLLTIFARLLTVLSTDQPPIFAGGGAGCLPRTDEPPGGLRACASACLGCAAEACCCSPSAAKLLSVPACQAAIGNQLASFPLCPTLCPHKPSAGSCCCLPPCNAHALTAWLRSSHHPPCRRSSAKSCCCRSRTPWSCAQRCDSLPSLEMWQRCAQRCDSCQAFIASSGFQRCRHWECCMTLLMVLQLPPQQRCAQTNAPTIVWNEPRLPSANSSPFPGACPACLHMTSLRAVGHFTTPAL